MEQAYMIYTRKFGQYGDGNLSTGSLAEGINGGWEEMCIHLFFGDRVIDDSVGFDSINNTEQNDNIIKTNIPVIEKLLGYAKQQNKEQKDKQENDVNLMARITMYRAMSNLLHYTQVIYRELAPRVNGNPKLQNALDVVIDITSEVYNYLDQKILNKQPIYSNIHDLSLRLWKNADFTGLGLDGYQEMRETMANISGFSRGSDPNENNINILTHHAYSVDTVILLDKDGKDITQDTSNDASANNISSCVQNLSGMSQQSVQQIRRIDANKSTVTLINPHAMNKPAINEAEKRPDDGKFTIPLRVFLNNIEHLRSATVRR